MQDPTKKDTIPGNDVLFLFRGLFDRTAILAGRLVDGVQGLAVGACPRGKRRELGFGHNRLGAAVLRFSGQSVGAALGAGDPRNGVVGLTVGAGPVPVPEHGEGTGILRFLVRAGADGVDHIRAQPTEG